MTRKEYPNPGPCPENATPKQVEAWRKAKEVYDCEGFQKLPKTPVKIDATDERLKQLTRDHKKFLERHNPMTDALWLALLRDATDVLYDAEMNRRYQMSIVTGERRDTVVDAPHRPAIVVMAEMMVANALRGDAAAFAEISNRTEGKPGLRRDDIDPEDPQRQRESRAIVEGVVRAMTAARIEAKIADAVDVGVKVIDTTPEPCDKVSPLPLIEEK